MANYGIIGFVVTLSFPRFFLSSISSTSFVMVRSVGLFCRRQFYYVYDALCYLFSHKSDDDGDVRCRDGRESIFLYPTQPNPPTYGLNPTHASHSNLREMQTHTDCRTRIFTGPLFREFLDHVSLSKIKGRKCLCNTSVLFRKQQSKI